MNDTQIPITIPGIDNNIYAGFWVRLGSMLLDGIIMLPIIFIILYVNGLSVNMYFYTIIPNLLFGIWYNIYLPKKYGGTPGKLIAGIKIIKMNGKPIGWKEAILRHSVLLALTIFSIITMIICLLKADETVFKSLDWLKRSEYLMSLAKTPFMIHVWASNIWIYGEFIVLLTNDRKRAAHDFIAGTVIVRNVYINKINEVMYSEKNDNSIEN
ncbi:RDD family protein [Flavobacterium sufflavum]|uniref:RDD family protein n=1 Tax=Flavobacterium sufflavum TaxID=1921138 RepID=A0A3S2V1C7_9FLAO|nr:RDD family protein [Flavobacterium sufflavum]RVT72757.1 RDD family protein [Flavobacterium sufflavum]